MGVIQASIKIYGRGEQCRGVQQYGSEIVIKIISRGYIVGVRVSMGVR